jgi:hypothetical protein
LGGDASDDRLGRREELDPLGLRALLLLGREDGNDDDAVDLEVGLGPHHVACFGTFIEDTGIEYPLGLTRSGSPPRPSAIRLGTCQLDIDPARHAVNLQPPTTPHCRALFRRSGRPASSGFETVGCVDVTGAAAPRR